MQHRTADVALLLDDNDTANYLNSDVIQRSGLARRVLCCTDSITARERLTELLADPANESVVMLVDVSMPGISGYEFLDELEENDSTSDPRLSIAMLTSSTLLRDVEVWERYLNVKAFIQKPLDAAKFQGLLDGTLKSPKS